MTNTLQTPAITPRARRPLMTPRERRVFTMFVAVAGPLSFAAGALAAIFSAVPGPPLPPNAGRGMPAVSSPEVAPSGTPTTSPPARRDTPSAADRAPADRTRATGRDTTRTVVSTPPGTTPPAAPTTTTPLVVPPSGKPDPPERDGQGGNDTGPGSAEGTEPDPGPD